MGRPNVWRVRACANASSRAACPTPSAWAAMAMRPISSARRATANPWFSSPMRSSSRTTTWSNTRSTHPSPRTPRESTPGALRMPSRSSGTTNAETPRPRAPGVVAAKTIATPADLAIGDPHLAARQGVAVTAACRQRLLVGGIRAGLGLRQRERPDDLAGDQARQPGGLLRGRARHGQRVAHQRVVDGKDDGHRRAGAGDRFDAKHAGDVIETAAAHRHRRAHAEVAAGSRLPHQVEGERAGLVDAGSLAARRSRARTLRPRRQRRPARRSVRDAWSGDRDAADGVDDHLR